jgi:hypothetical protein
LQICFSLSSLLATPTDVQVGAFALLETKISNISILPEGCANSVSCGEVVFVDEAAEPVAAPDGGW